MQPTQPRQPCHFPLAAAIIGAHIFAGTELGEGYLQQALRLDRQRIAYKGIDARIQLDGWGLGC